MPRTLFDQMKCVAKASDLALLADIRGKFGESKFEQILKYIFSGFLTIGCPAFLLAIICAHGPPQFPLDSAQWFLVLLGLVNCALGVPLWQFAAQTYVFDGTTIRQLTGSGRVWKEIEIQKMTTITFRRIKGISSMQLQTQRMTMGVLLYPHLAKEIQIRIEQAARAHAG